MVCSSVDCTKRWHMGGGKKRRSVDLVVSNKVGLHARPAAVLVRLAQTFESDVVISCGTRSANAKSILGILTLCAERGAEVTVVAEGQDADRAIEAITELFARAFDEKAGGDGGAAIGFYGDSAGTEGMWSRGVGSGLSAARG
jgi:phosphotransferase system HPr (HPr) family protein